jgi:nucleoside-diphosphate-sugar epimerase
MNFKNICITGATGFIGSHLLLSLMGEGVYSITAIIKNQEMEAVIRVPKVTYYTDNGNTGDLVNFFRDRGFDCVIHLASVYLKDHSSDQIGDLIESNVLFGTRLLEASVSSGIRAFINTGTSWQHYQGSGYSPVNLYAASKQAFEDIAKYYMEKENLYFVTLKLNDTYGPGDTRRKIFNIWNNLKEGEPLKMSPGEQLIDIMHIFDVVSAFKALLAQVSEDLGARCYVGTSFSIHNSRIVTLKELAGIYETVSGKKLTIEWGGLSYREREVMVPWRGGESIRGWRQKITLEEGIISLIKA